MYKKSHANKSRNNFKGGSNRRKSGRKAPKKYINPEKFINRNVIEVEEKPHFDESVNFADFAFVPVIQANLAKNNFKHPSEIQKKAIPLALEGRDIIGLSNTGTGKTIAFALPILNGLISKAQPQDGVLDLRESAKKQPRKASKMALILAPTRELAQQINEEFRKFSDKTGVHSALLVGGMNIGAQFRDLRRKPQMLIGTPGRVKDHIERGSIDLSKIEFFVLDEADRMLDMGFVNDIREIISQLPENRQTFCFSATFDARVQKITSDFMKNPEMISVSQNQTAEHIHQDIVEFTDMEDRKNLLFEILARNEVKKIVIFGETKFGVQRLSDELEKNGFSSRSIHGDKNQAQRTRAIKAFRTGAADILVATDVAARGLDIPDVSHVINFDTPQSYEDYIHRIGRTGRGGKAGSALTFVSKMGAKEPKEAVVGVNPRRKQHDSRMGKNSGKNFRGGRDFNTGKTFRKPKDVATKAPVNARRQNRRKSPEDSLVALANSQK